MAGISPVYQRCEQQSCQHQQDAHEQRSLPEACFLTYGWNPRCGYIQCLLPLVVASTISPCLHPTSCPTTYQA